MAVKINSGLTDRMNRNAQELGVSTNNLKKIREKQTAARTSSEAGRPSADKAVSSIGKPFKEKTGWQYRENGTRKSFDELSTAEVLTWIGTLPENERAQTARQFETDYLKNPGSTRYDPYYTDYSNNDEARQLFGVNTFDQSWIDKNRGYYNYLTFSGENYSTPKKPGANATEEEKAAYQYWQIANTYEATTQSAEAEYDKLRQEVARRIETAKKAGDTVDADEIIGAIDWNEYKTLSDLREAAKIGNPRMLNRPVQVGDSSIRSMVSAAIRGEDVSENRDFVWAESQYLSRPKSAVESAMDAGARDALGADQKAPDAAVSEKGEIPKADIEEQPAVDTAGFMRDLGRAVTGLHDRTVEFTDEEIERIKAAKDTETQRVRLQEKLDSTRKMLDVNNAQIGELETMLSGMVEDDPERENVIGQIGRLKDINEAISSTNAAAGNALAGLDVARNMAIQMEENIYGSAEIKERQSAQYNEYVGSLRAQFGLDQAVFLVESRIETLEELAQTEEDEELLEELKEQLYLLKTESDERNSIAQETFEALDAQGMTGGRGILHALWKSNYLDAIIDGDKVPLEDYEKYMRYRLTPGETQYEDMAKYDQMDRGEALAGGLAMAVQTGVKAINIPMQALEEVMYWAKSKLYGDMTREELYAADKDLNALRAWNATFENTGADEKKVQQFAEEYPGVKFITDGLGEVLKMGVQGDMAGMISDLLGGLPVVQKLVASGTESSSWAKAFGLQNLPFSLDAFANSVKTAREEGADDDQAFIAGSLTGALVGPMSGFVSDTLQGIGAKLFASKAGKKAAQEGAAIAAKNGWANALWSLVKSGLWEGFEEAIEEPAEGLIAKAVYDRGRAWLGEGGVVDPKAMLQSGVMGAAVGPAFTILSGLSGRLGETSKGITWDIIERLKNGEEVTLAEIERAQQRLAREAAVQDRAEEIEAQAAPEMEAAAEQARAAADEAVKAKEASKAATAQLAEERKANQPVLDAFNNGTASYSDPVALDQLNKRSEATKKAQEESDRARQAYTEAQENAQKAADKAEKTITRIQGEARAEAEKQVDQELQAEQEAEAQALAEEAKKEAERPEQPGVHYSTKRKNALTADQQAQMNILDALGKKYGVEIDVVDTLKGKNGMYAGGRRVTVALDAAESAYVQTAVHEMIHYIRNYSEGAYGLVETVALGWLEGEGFETEEEIDKRMAEYKGAQKLTREQALEEIIAEAVPTVFSNEEAMRDFVERDRTLAQRVRDFFVDFARTLSNIARRYVDRTKRTEIAFLSENVDALMDIADALDMALMEAGSKSNEHQKKSTDERMKFSLNESVEQAGSLMAVHNLTEDKLQKALKLGGFPMPSIAIAKADIGHQNFGDISLVFGRETIDPKADRKNKVYSADAWTPTFPQIQYEEDRKATDKVYTKVHDLADRLPDEYRNKANSFVGDLEYQMNRYGGEEGLIDAARNNYGFKAAYLADSGTPVKMVKTTRQEGGVSPVMAERYEKILKIFDGDVYAMLEMPLNEMIEKYGEELKAVSARAAKDRIILARVIRNTVDYAMGSKAEKTVEVDDIPATNRAIDEKIDAEAYEEWLHELFTGVEKQSGVYNGKEIFTPSGNRRSFSQTHYPVTVENIAKAMLGTAGGDAKNVSGFHGVKSLRAATAETFGSVQAMHKREGRLQARTQEEADALNDRLNEQLNDLIDRIVEAKGVGKYDNRLIAMDAVGEVLMDVAKKKYTIESIRAELVKYNYPVDDKIAAEIKKIFDETANMPVNIFEAKPERAVYFDEVKAAIVPDSMDAGVREELGKFVENVIVYPDGDEGARLKALNSMPDIRFSMNNTGSIADALTDDQSQMQPKNGNVKATSIRAQTDVVDEVRAAEKGEFQSGAARLAKRIVRQYKSQTEVSISEAAAEIDLMLDAYQQHEDGKAEEIADRLAKRIVEGSRETDLSHREGYEEIRRRLRETGFSLTDTQRQEAANRYGSANDWRKSVMGSVKVKNGAASLDSIWSQMSEMHPEYFPADATEGEMPEYISAFVAAMKPRYRNSYGMDAETAAADLSLVLQADVNELMARKEQAEALRNSSESLRETISAQTEEKRRKKDEKRQKEFSEIAEIMRSARASGDNDAIIDAMDRYRKLTGGKSRAADAIEAGALSRKLKAEADRTTRMIQQIEDSIKSKDDDSDLDKLKAERDQLTGVRDDLLRQSAALHRQEAIEREGMDAEEAEDIALSEEMRSRMNGDMSRAIDEHVVEMRGRIKAMWSRAKAKNKEFSVISTLTEKQKIEVFEDLEGEIVQAAELEKVWKKSAEVAEGQRISETELEAASARDLARAKERGDKAAIMAAQAQILDSRDRQQVLACKQARAEAKQKYYARIGRESLQQAMREGRLPQPIMERVLAMVKDARKMEVFNVNAAMDAIGKSLETERTSPTVAIRVWDDIFGDAAPLMRAIYYDPVMDNETARQKWIKDWRDRLRQLDLTKEESYQVQKLGEGKMAYDENVEVSEKVRHAIKVYRMFYEEAHAMATNALTRNGYKAPGYISDYFPHLNIPQTFLEKLGIPVEHGALPTSINGLTETFKPGKQYSSHLLTRKGDTTDYDAMYGFEEYVGAISGVIFHTDDIQRHRQLESEIRAAAANDESWPDRNVHGESFFANHFVNWLNEYTNLLAGKKSAIDRSFEKAVTGRVIYNAANQLKGIKGAHAVMGNIASAVTNLVPVTLVTGEHPMAMLKGAAQMLKGSVAGRGNIPESQFLIRRNGSSSIIETMYTRYSKFAGKPFELVDALASNLVVNAYYQHNLDLGMDSETAMRNADSKAARVMGDRSKGAMPNMYGSAVFGFLTQFQYEVANQSQYLRKDVWREKGTGKGLIAMLGASIAAWLFNNLAEAIIGRRPAADPIDMVVDVYDTVQNGGGGLQVVQSLYNSASEIFPYIGQGRIAATEGIVDLLTTVFEDGADGNDVLYALKETAWSFVPSGGQIKKTIKGAQALINEGVYNTSGKQLKYAIDHSNPLIWAQTLVFGPSATASARDYYEGRAPGLTAARTEDYEQARERGYTGPEAYRNEADKAAAEKLVSEAKKAEKADVESKKLAEIGETGAQADLEKAAEQRTEAAKLREEAVPGEQLTDYWWEKKDRPSVQAGIEIWRMTGEDWALPNGYGKKTQYTINGSSRYLGAELAAEADREYEEGYEEIMGGIDPAQMDKEELEEVKKALEKLKQQIDKQNKQRIIEERGEEVDW